MARARRRVQEFDPTEHARELGPLLDALMPLESLETGVPWDWSSFGEYLGKVEGQLGVNAGFMVGHSALRRVVMGERAVGHEASEAELQQMVELLRTSSHEGGRCSL